MKNKENIIKYSLYGITISLLITCISLISVRLFSDAFKGEKGEIGEIGIKGEKGETGEKGESGINGIDGFSFTKGNEKPSEESGKNKDLYLDLSTGDLYQKQDGKWTFLYNIKGEKGDKGNDGNKGNDGVDGTNGETLYTSTFLPSENGIILCDNISAKIGETVTFIFLPNGGYTVSSITFNGANETIPSEYEAGTTLKIEKEMIQNGYVVSATFLVK